MTRPQTVATLRGLLVELRALREDLEERGLLMPLPRPKLEGGETWVRDPEEEDS